MSENYVLRLASIVLCVILIAFQSNANDQVQIAAGLWVDGKTYDVPNNEVPFYNFSAFTTDEQKANRQFLANFRTPEAKIQGFQRAMVLGWDSFFRQDYATAAKRFNQANLIKPGHSHALHGFAVIAIVRFGDMELGEQLLQYVVTKDDVADNAFFDLGLLLMNKGRPKEAASYLRMATQRQPKYPPAWLNLVVSLASSGKRDESCRLILEIRNRFDEMSTQKAASDLNARLGCGT